MPGSAPFVWRVALGLVAAGMLGCHPTAPAEVEFWALGREGESVRALIPEFERRTPGVRVRVQQIPWSAAHEKLLTAYVGGTLPDVIQIGNTWIPEMVALDALAPLDDPIAASADVRRGDFFEGIFDTNVIDGRVYAVPWYVDTRLLFYRRDLLVAAGVDAAPTTWAAWIDAMERVARRVGQRGRALLLPLGEWQPLVAFAMQHDARLLRDDGDYGDFRAAAFRTGFAFYVDLFRRGFASPSGAAQVANLYRDFAEERFVFYIGGPWIIGELARRVPELAGRWATAPLPSPDAGRPGVSIAGGASLALVRTARDPAAAWRLIEYLAAPTQQIAFFRLTGDLPARRSAWTDGALGADAAVAAFARQLERVRATPKVPEWERIATKIGEHAEAVVRGHRDIDTALAALDADVDAILEKRRWMRRERARHVAGGAVR